MMAPVGDHRDIQLSIGFVVGYFCAATTGTVGPSQGWTFWGNMINMICGWLYLALSESSTKQATLGKMAMGIKVTDLHGDRISLGRASGRCLAKIVSTVIVLIGYLMIAFTRRKQGLHDIMAGCLVVNK